MAKMQQQIIAFICCNTSNFSCAVGNCFAYFEPSVPRDIAIVLMVIHQIVAYGLVSALPSAPVP